MKQYLSGRMFPEPDFPVSVTRLLQRSQMPQHTHDFIEFVLVAGGYTIHYVGTGKEQLSYGLIQGDCFTILPGEIHAYSESHNLILYNVAFKEELLQNVQTQQLTRQNLLSKLKQLNNLLAANKSQ